MIIPTSGFLYVAVVILNWNGKKYLDTCIRSIQSQTYPNMSVLLVDNNSIDDSVQFVQKNFPSVKVIRNKENLGFAEGNNVGIRHALASGADCVLILNNDTEVEPDFVSNLVNTCQNEPEIGIVGAKVLDMDDRKIILEMGATCDIFGYPRGFFSNIIDANQYKEVFEVFYSSGCAMLVKKEVFNKIGLFDSSYFLFAEDLDLCWRAQLASYKVVVCSKAVVYHKGGGTALGGSLKNSVYTTTTSRIYFRERNTLRTLIKNYAKTNLLTIIPVYVYLLLLQCFFLSIRQPKAFFACINAIIWNFRNLKDTLRERSKIQSRRLVNDSKIKQKMINGIEKIRTFILVEILKVV